MKGAYCSVRESLQSSFMLSPSTCPVTSSLQHPRLCTWISGQKQLDAIQIALQKLPGRTVCPCLGRFYQHTLVFTLETTDLKSLLNLLTHPTISTQLFEYFIVTFPVTFSHVCNIGGTLSKTDKYVDGWVQVGVDVGVCNKNKIKFLCKPPFCMWLHLFTVLWFTVYFTVAIGPKRIDIDSLYSVRSIIKVMGEDKPVIKPLESGRTFRLQVISTKPYQFPD